ncbi:MAG: dihydrofolate reductase family protein, partial [Candidatus Daviesbacteria bacterium]|nr:dihydrofolate reductase family protein [Candidatus Daviesbacteria bacterium]
KEGLSEYYDLEKQTDLHSLNTGRVMAKIGVNTRDKEPTKIKASFIIIDSKPHLNEKGVEYLAKWVKTLYLITTNKQHPAFTLKEQYPNIKVIYYDQKINLEDLLHKLKNDYGINNLTIQSGGTLNAEWVRQGLIDRISIVIAPCLVGGKDTSTLIDGESLHNEEDLRKIKALKLLKCEVLKNNYIHVLYEVINETQTITS